MELAVALKRELPMTEHVHVSIKETIASWNFE